jgi:AraC-like DNA-binding protein
MDYLENSFTYLAPSDLNMYYCGKRLNTYNHSYGPAVRDHFLLVYIKDGKGTLETRNKLFKLTSKSLLVMFPGNKVFYQVAENTPWTIFWLGLYGKLTYSYLDALGITPEKPLLKIDNAKEIESTMEIIFKKSASNDLSDKIDCIGLLHRFFAELAENLQIVQHKKDYVEQAINFIKYNYERGISARDIASYLKLDRSHFTKIFKKETGATPTQWLNEIRIKKACDLLKGTDLTIKEVAYSVGIFDQFYFSRLFKAATSYAPSCFRKLKL